MTAELKFAWARLTANYWFYPAVFALGAAALAFATLAIDRSGAADALNDVDWLIPIRPQGASTFLSVMASSMIGTAATVFSITIAAVVFASGNFGPRLLTNFLEDRGNQIGLAILIGAFVYALVVLRAVRGEDETPNIASEAASTLPGFAPQLSLLVAYAITVLAVAALVYLLNHIPSSIRINIVLQQIGHRLIAMIRETYPVEDEFSDPRKPAGGKPLRAWDTGYIQMIDFAELENLARTQDCTFSLHLRTGDFVHRAMPMLDVDGAEPDTLEDRIRECFSLGASRTPTQDPQFLIDQLVEIGLRALSPGINDPFTAITALHWLGAATAEIGRRDLRKDVCAADADDCPVIPVADSFESYLDRGFGAMRSAVAESPNAARVMLEALANAAAPISSGERLSDLRHHGRMLMEQAREALVGPDLAMVEERFAAFNRAFHD